MTEQTPEIEGTSNHVWKPTTNTLAVWKCSRCGAVAFAPHPRPKGGCHV